MISIEAEGPLPPRRAQRLARRRSIMDATEALLSERTYADLRIEDVMTASGLTRTAFYRYFTDLESVLLAWLTGIRAELADAANQWLLSDMDPDAGVVAATRGLAEVWSRHRFLLLAMADASLSGSRIQLAWREMVDSFVGPVGDRLDELIGQGRTHLTHPAETARALVWMNERYLFETYARDRQVPVDVAGQTLAVIWRRTLFAPPEDGDRVRP